MKVMATVVVILFLIIIGLVVTLCLISGDIPPSDYPDMVLQRPDIPPDENAYTYFEAASKALSWPDETETLLSYLDGTETSEDEARVVVDSNADMIRSLRQGLSCEICLAPEVTGFDSLLPYISQWRNMGRVMALKCRLERLSATTSEATESCVSILRFAHLIQRDAECLINYLVGVAVLEIGLEQARDIARDEKSSPADLSELEDAISEIGRLDKGFTRAIKVEHKIVMNMIDDFAEGKFGMNELMSLSGEGSPLFKIKRMPGYLFQPNKTKLMFASFYRDMISAAPLVYSEMEFPDDEELLGATRNKVMMVLRPNAVGRILHALMLPALGSMLERKCRTETSITVTQLISALNRYKKTNKTFPKDLNELIPDFLEALPLDGYDGLPLRYDAERGIVYSIGKDCIDSGGDSEATKKARWRSDDAVFSIAD